MDYKLLGKSVLNVGTVIAVTSGVIFGGAYLVHTYGIGALMFPLICGLLYLAVSIEYERQKYLKAMGKK